jgi:hypothetical protein
VLKSNLKVIASVKKFLPSKEVHLSIGSVGKVWQSLDRLVKLVLLGSQWLAWSGYSIGFLVYEYGMEHGSSNRNGMARVTSYPVLGLGVGTTYRIMYLPTE